MTKAELLQTCPHCGAFVRFTGWRQQRARFGDFGYGRGRARYNYQQVRVLYRDADFGVCPACHETVSA